MVLHMFHNHYETHFPSRNPTPIQGFHFEVFPRNILSFLSFPKPLRNSNPDLRELIRFRGQVWFGIPGKFLLSSVLKIWNFKNNMPKDIWKYKIYQKYIFTLNSSFRAIEKLLRSKPSSSPRSCKYKHITVHVVHAPSPVHAG